MHVGLTLILWENVLTFSIFLRNAQDVEALTRALRCSVRDWFLLLSRIFSMNRLNPFTKSTCAIRSRYGRNWSELVCKLTIHLLHKKMNSVVIEPIRSIDSTYAWADGIIIWSEPRILTNGEVILIALILEITQIKRTGTVWDTYTPMQDLIYIIYSRRSIYYATIACQKPRDVAYLRIETGWNHYSLWLKRTVQKNRMNQMSLT